MNYVVYYSNPNDEDPSFVDFETLEQARQCAQYYAKAQPGVEVYLAQKISTFVSEVTIKET